MSSIVTSKIFLSKARQKWYLFKNSYKLCFINCILWECTKELVAATKHQRPPHSVHHLLQQARAPIENFRIPIISWVVSHCKNKHKLIWGSIVLLLKHLSPWRHLPLHELSQSIWGSIVELLEHPPHSYIWFFTIHHLPMLG